MEDSSVEQLLRGLASQIAEKEDHVLCSDVRNKLFGPLEFSRSDLGKMAVLEHKICILSFHKYIHEYIMSTFACAFNTDLYDRYA